MTDPSATRLVIFGATGDLAQRMLLPSLLALERDHLLPDELAVLGCARSEMDSEAFAQFCRESLTDPDAAVDEQAIQRLCERLDYRSVDLDSADALDRLLDHIVTWRTDGAILFHLSTAPSWYATVCAALARAGLNDA